MSSFQVHISDHEILTPGDTAERARGDEPGGAEGEHRRARSPGGTLIVNADTFEERNLDKAGYEANPLEDGSLAAYRVIQVPMTAMTLEAPRSSA